MDGANNMSETHTRTWIRTLTYRIAALLITALWTGLGDAVAIHIVLALLHTRTYLVKNKVGQD